MARFLLLFYVFMAFILGQDFQYPKSEKFGPPLNTQNVEYSPVIAPNGRYIVFQSNRPDGQGGMDLWISENKNYQNRTGKPIWGEPINFRELNTSGFEGPFSILFDREGKPIEIFFTSLKDPKTGRSGLGGLNLYVTKNLTRKSPPTDRWSLPEHLLLINTNFDEKMPAISPDGKTLVFSSNRPGGFGGFDLWVSNRDTLEGKWSEPINLGNQFNTSANEIMPAFHYDGLTLFFSSDRGNENHKYNIYMAHLEDPSLTLAEGELIEPYPDSSKKPTVPKLLSLKKLPPPYNSMDDDEGISLTHDGLWAYLSSNRIGGEGQFDIYRIPITEDLRKPYAFELMGVVVDGSEEIMIGLDSTLKIYNSSGLVKIITSKRIGGDISSKEKNPTEPVNFRTRILTGDIYKVEVSSPGFHPNQFSLDLRGSVGFNKSKYVKIILMPIEEEKTPTEESPVAKKDVPITPTSEEVPTKKSLSTRVVLKDQTTKKIIDKGKVTLFQEKESNGKQLPKDKEFFVLEEMPSEDFELMGSAKGYKSETLSVKKDNLDIRKQNPIEIFLWKKTDYPKIYDTVILFEFNEYKILDSQKKYLDELAAYFQKNPKEIVEIGGHTDNLGSKEYNVNLSSKRAEVIKKYLIDKGVSETQLQTKAYWYSQPVADNSTEEGRAKNRRVSFKKIKL